MAYTHYDRLSALDSTFLDIEDPSVHMHVGAVAILEKDRPRTVGGTAGVGCRGARRWSFRPDRQSSPLHGRWHRRHGFTDRNSSAGTRRYEH
ncbi:MAG: hypothetical protein ACI8TX_000146 [Hyphomicrobiaceae bacterium]|jgi:hypothetical protein